MSKISSIEGRILYNSRGSKTIEIDVKSEGKFLGRVCAPSGASVGKYEAVSFPNGKPEEMLRRIQENSQKCIGLESRAITADHHQELLSHIKNMWYLPRLQIIYYAMEK